MADLFSALQLCKIARVWAVTAWWPGFNRRPDGRNPAIKGVAISLGCRWSLSDVKVTNPEWHAMWIDNEEATWERSGYVPPDTGIQQERAGNNNSRDNAIYCLEQRRRLCDHCCWLVCMLAPLRKKCAVVMTACMSDMFRSPCHLHVFFFFYYMCYLYICFTKKMYQRNFQGRSEMIQGTGLHSFFFFNLRGNAFNIMVLKRKLQQLHC